MPQLTIGLTGGLGSGKTTACDFFKKKSIPVIDADDIAKELSLQPHIKRRIASVLGRSFIGLHGNKQRNFIRRIFLRCIRRRRALEKILHPLVWRIIAQRIACCETEYCVVAVPLLLECKKQVLFDRVLVVDAPQLSRIRRVQRRSHWALREVLAMMSLQVTRGARLAGADDVINNAGHAAQLSAQVLQLDKKYRAIAGQGRA